MIDIVERLKLALTGELVRIRSFRDDWGHSTARPLLSERDPTGRRYDCAPGPCACSRNPPLEGDRRSCGDMLIPRSRQGGRLAITRSSVPAQVKAGWGRPAGLHLMPQDFSNPLWIDDLGKQFTIPFSRSYVKTVSFLAR